ncbi:carboxymuconolactone decarboxylase family protein [Blastococcus sp. BMG 814]|uniref:Carboxymuconolactone decarboxylase family protein n=1 Tax=Blastococcus carthaginiensis TaxID=3050034 RepID=A0ABT9I7V8_9ACTN|nr:carboxymuconolactone decarboxylase family protein [Blastococcus carthaginiensis]MDP5181638.1 carboxymuconolactone decarboxylase family protein [Blastococcus carthaginiensis]
MPEELTGRPAPRGPARLPLLHPAQLDGERARLHAEITRGPRQAQSSVVPLTDDAGRLMGPFAAMLLEPRIGSAVQAVGAALRGEQLLGPRARELAILAVAVRRRSHFEWLAHEQAARAAGVPTAQLQALLDGRVPDGLDPVDEAVVVATWRLLDDGELDDAGYAEATSVLGLEALAALVWLVGYYAMLATALATFRPDGATPSAG